MREARGLQSSWWWPIHRRGRCRGRTADSRRLGGVLWRRNEDEERESAEEEAHVEQSLDAEGGFDVDAEDEMHDVSSLDLLAC